MAELTPETLAKLIDDAFFALSKDAPSAFALMRLAAIRGKVAWEDDRERLAYYRGREADLHAAMMSELTPETLWVRMTDIDDGRARDTTDAYRTLAVDAIRKGEAAEKVNRLLAGALSTFGRWTTMHPEAVLDEFWTAAREGGK